VTDSLDPALQTQVLARLERPGSPLRANAAEALRPDADGYIRHWIMLAPIAIPEQESCANALLEEQIKGEATLRPRAGDKIRIGGKELTWRNITAPTNYFDFNAILNSAAVHVAGFMVTYIECDQAMTNVTMTLGSNDQGRLYLNGTDIYAFTEARTLELDADKGRVTLNKGCSVPMHAHAPLPPSAPASGPATSRTPEDGSWSR